MNRRALYGRYHPTFNDFRAAIQEVQDGLSAKYAEGLATLMRLNFQQFEDILLMAARGITFHRERECSLKRPCVTLGRRGSFRIVFGVSVTFA